MVYIYHRSKGVCLIRRIILLTKTRVEKKKPDEILIYEYIHLASETEHIWIKVYENNMILN